MTWNPLPRCATPSNGPPAFPIDAVFFERPHRPRVHAATRPGSPLAPPQVFLHRIRPCTPLKGWYIVGSYGIPSIRVVQYRTMIRPHFGGPQVRGLIGTVSFLEVLAQSMLLLDFPVFLLGVPFGTGDLLPQFSVGQPDLGGDLAPSNALAPGHSYFCGLRRRCREEEEALDNGTFWYFTRLRGWVKNTMGSVLAACFS